LFWLASAQGEAAQVPTQWSGGVAANVVLPPMAQRQNSRSANRGGAVVLQVMRVLFLDECNAHFIAVHPWATVDV
jgi:hypothetical protein